MPASTIIVQYGDGSPARRVAVRMEFREGLTDVCYTDNHGQVVVEHESVGTAKIYVSGRNRGSFHAPGRLAVTIT